MSNNKDLENEKRLIEAAQEDPDQFIHLYDKYFDQIYRYVYRRTGTKDTAHDLSSQTFLDALTHIKKFVWKGFPFSSWLYKIAHNNVIKWYRERSKSNYTPIEEAYSLSDTKQDQKNDVDVLFEQAQVQEMMKKLDDEEKEILRLKFFENVSNIEIADILGLSVSNVGVKVFRTLKKAKGLLPTKHDLKQLD